MNKASATTTTAIATITIHISMEQPTFTTLSAHGDAAGRA